MVLTSKAGPCVERIKLFIIVVDPYHVIQMKEKEQTNTFMFKYSVTAQAHVFSAWSPYFNTCKGSMFKLYFSISNIKNRLQIPVI